MSFFADLETALFWIRTIAFVGILITTLELLYRARDYRDDRIWSWKVLETMSVGTFSGLRGELARRLFRYPNFIAVLGLRLIAVFVVLWPRIPQKLLLAALAVTAGTTLLINLRSSFGQDGSDQMSSLLAITLLISEVDPENLVVRELCLWFLASQACLSYLASGLAKIPGRKWRDGSAVFEIFNTRSYGARSVSKILRRFPLMGRLLTWQTVLVETLFPLALVLPTPLRLGFLAWGLTFHGINALVMGLNSFVWAFAATYPAILFCAEKIQGTWSH